MFTRHFYTWPAEEIEPQTFWSWVQRPIHLVTSSHTSHTQKHWAGRTRCKWLLCDDLPVTFCCGDCLQAAFAPGRWGSDRTWRSCTGVRAGKSRCRESQLACKLQNHFWFKHTLFMKKRIGHGLKRDKSSLLEELITRENTHTHSHTETGGHQQNSRYQNLWLNLQPFLFILTSTLRTDCFFCDLQL